MLNERVVGYHCIVHPLRGQHLHGLALSQTELQIPRVTVMTYKALGVRRVEERVVATAITKIWTSCACSASKATKLQNMKGVGGLQPACVPQWPGL